MAHRQSLGAVEAAFDVLPGIERHPVAWRDPPQHAIDLPRPRRLDRSVAIGADDKAMIGQHGDAERTGFAGMAAHDRATHVGAVSEVQRHDAGKMLGRSAAQTENASAMTTGTAIRATKPKIHNCSMPSDETPLSSVSR